MLIDELHDVLYVPIQSVVTVDEKELCYVKASGREEKREVVTGLFNDDFVEIKSGLTQGEKVLLNPPRWTASETKEETKEKAKEEAKEETKEEAKEEAKEETKKETKLDGKEKS